MEPFAHLVWRVSGRARVFAAADIVVNAPRSTRAEPSCVGLIFIHKRHVDAFRDFLTVGRVPEFYSRIVPFSSANVINFDCPPEQLVNNSNKIHRRRNILV